MTYAKWVLYQLMISCILLGGCVDNTYAPVVNAWHDPSAIKSRYRVQKDDTIYSIAWAFDMDYRDLARINNLNPPYALTPGQTLSMHIPASSKASEAHQEVIVYAVQEGGCDYIDKPVILTPCLPQPRGSALPHVIPPMDLNLPELEQHSIDYTLPQKTFPHLTTPQQNLIEPPKQTAVTNKDKIIVSQNHCKYWQWPARGKILKEFSLQEGGSKGIDIAGNLGDPIRAVAPGRVVYSGSGLRGYGNLVIIKHSENYLSAYAYNKKLLVKEGDVVKAGVEIGKMGQNDSGEVLLHFEIRRNGKPVNPLLYL